MNILIQFCVIYCTFLIGRSSSSFLGLPDPLKAIENITSYIDKKAEQFSDDAKTFVGQIVQEAKNDTESAVRVIENVTNNTKILFNGIGKDVKSEISSISEDVANETHQAIDVIAKLAKGVNSSLKQVENDTNCIEENVISNVINDTKVVSEAAQQVGFGLVNDTEKILLKANKGLFNVENGVITGVDEVVGTPVNLEDVTFYLITAKKDEEPSPINFYNPEHVSNTQGKIYILIHGFESSMNASWYFTVSKALLRQHPNAHIVQINWSKPASDLYPLAAFKTESVGNLVGVFINRLVSEYKFRTENLVVIGHSLGGQIAGWAAKKFSEITGFKLPRIVALDPAGPLFALRPESRRLNERDALVVMVIHTDGDKLGFPFSCGSIEFYPNGGDNQPGCWNINVTNPSTISRPVTCDHIRVEALFAEAINCTESFPSRKCGSYQEFLDNKCKGDTVVFMGDLETTEKGSFYLKTNAKRPFSRPLSTNEVDEKNNKNSSFKSVYKSNNSAVEIVLSEKNNRSSQCA